MFDHLFRRSPSSFKLQINSPALTLEVQAKESLLVAALKQGVAFPHNCRVGGCGECKCKLVSGKVKELSDKSYLLSSQELAQHYILACQSLPRSDLVIEVALREVAASAEVVHTPARIVALTPLTEDIVHLQLQAQLPMAYRAGQYAEFELPDACGDAKAPGQGATPTPTPIPIPIPTRCYSFASAQNPAPGDVLDFFIRKVPDGAFTHWLFTQARVGQALQIRGPFGDFGLHADASPMVCIAGGSGLAPIKAMLEQAIRDGQTRRALVLILGVRTQADLFAQDDIDQIRRQWSGRFSYHPILSEDKGQGPWEGLWGMIGEHLPALLGEHLPQYQAYLCGPPQMVDACVDVLSRSGMAPQRMHCDRFVDRGRSPAN